MTLLVVDDDDDVRGMFADSLRGEGHWVLEASSAREAKERLAENATSIRLVLTDVRMPGENGLVLANHVDQHYPDIAVLLVSGEVNGADTGSYPIILKPVSLSRLASVVADLLGGQPRRVELHSDGPAVGIRNHC